MAEKETKQTNENVQENTQRTKKEKLVKASFDYWSYFC